MNLREKIKSRRGESIAEVLVALLISTCGIMMLAGMIGSATNIVAKSRSSMEEYYKRNNYLETYGNDAVSGVSHGTGTISFENLPGLSNQSVNIYINDKNGLKVISYKLQSSESGS